MRDTPAIDVLGVSKAFGATAALSDVDVSIPAGSVHGLIGGNGAGKSTLLKILTGIHRPDAGRISLFGADYRPRNPHDALKRGVAIIPQELRAVGAMSVADNVMLGYWPQRMGMVDRKQAIALATQQLERLGLAIDPRCRLDELSFAERQSVVIARTIVRRARVLIMDEPTAALSGHEAELLFDIIAKLKAQHHTIVYVSHRLDEIEKLCDGITALFNGRVVARFERGRFSKTDLIEAITGERLHATAARDKSSHGAPILETSVPTPAGERRLAVAAGQIAGIHGLLGSGIGPLMRGLFGARRAGGPVRIGGAPVHLRSPAHAIASGVGYVPSERFRAIFPALSVRDNILLPHLDGFAAAGRLRTGAMNAAVAPLMARLDIRPRDPLLPAGTLSGGNQQKVLFARWLLGATRFMLLDEPTHGVDVGAKALIKKQIENFAAQDGGVLMHSTELDELIDLVDDIHLMVAGELTRHVRRSDTDFDPVTLKLAL